MNLYAVRNICGDDAGGPARMRRAGVLLLAPLAMLVPVAMLVASPAFAQQSGDGDDGGLETISQPVVQAIPNRDSLTLNAALTALARNPRDINALIDAGTAALTMGDVDAATGFFRRADQVSPGNAKAKAGLAGALVRNGNPYDAIPLFFEAERAGAIDSALAADRGLAYDLVGDNLTAQTYYKLALSRGADSEVTRRLAISQAIAGDKRGAEATLAPQLRVQDKSAWRVRAFALAIGGQVDEAVTIARTILPGDLAVAISPYLRYMPKLTPAQQAAAANFGNFPRASEIGQDDPRIAQFATKRPVALASAGAALVPKGEALGRRARGRAARDGAKAAASTPAVAPSRQRDRTNSGGAVASTAPANRSASPAVPAAPPVPARPAVALASPSPLPSPARISASTPSAAPVAPPMPTLAAAPPAPAAPAPTGTMSSSDATRAATVAPVSASAAPSPGFSISGLLDKATPGTTASPTSSSQPATLTLPPPPRQSSIIAAPAPPAKGSASASAAPEPIAAPVVGIVASDAPASSAPVKPAPRPTLAEAFRDLGRPTTDAAPAAGAVDVRRIAPARPRSSDSSAKDAKAEEKPARPAPPSHPSRIWVQVATGRDKGALSFDWRRISRQAGDVAKGRQGYISAWGQTNRLLTGPFESESQASGFIAQLRRTDVDGAFLWRSPAGQVVDAIAGK